MSDEEENLVFEHEELELESNWREVENYLTADVSFMSETVTKEKLKPWEEIEASMDLWEGSYVTLDHPDNLILEDVNDVIGRLVNVEKNEEDRRLEGEIRIYKNLPSHASKYDEEEWSEIVEVARSRDKISQGYYYDPEFESGTYDGENGGPLEYEAIRRDILPNHTALVENPACSPEQGCGIDLEVEEVTIEEIMSNHSPRPVEDEEWDADEAEEQIRRWAGDGSTDKEDIDFDEYFKGFVYRDADNKDNFGAYKLPHHKIQGGELVTSERGVIAAGNAIEGARGGVDLPEGQVSEARSHLTNHYEQFDRVPPWQDNESEEEVDKMDIREKIKSKLNEIEKLLHREDDSMEEENEPQCSKEDCEEEMEEDTSNRLEEVEAELEKLREENEELKEHLSELENDKRERLIEEADDLTDLSESELEDKTNEDLEVLIEGAKSSKKASNEEAGPNLNSAPGSGEEAEVKQKPSVSYWKDQKGD